MNFDRAQILDGMAILASVLVHINRAASSGTGWWSA